jgi:hypothetical protein
MQPQDEALMGVLREILLSGDPKLIECARLNVMAWRECLVVKGILRPEVKPKVRVLTIMPNQRNEVSHV